MMRAGKIVDQQEYWNQAEAIGFKIQAFNSQVQDKIRILNSKDWDEIDPERTIHSPYHTEGIRKFSGACFWFLFGMLYERHLCYTEWTQLFELLETSILTPPTRKAIPTTELKLSSHNFTGKHPSKRTKSLSKRFEVQSMRSVSNTRDRTQYTLSDDIGLLQLRNRVSKLQGPSKLEPESDNQLSNSRKNSQIEESRTDHASSKKSTSQPITNFYPVIKTEYKTEDILTYSPIRSHDLSRRCSPRPSARKLSAFLGAPLTSFHKSVSIDELIAEFTKEHQEVQSAIKQQLATVKHRAYSDYTQNIGCYMTLDRQDYETQNRSAIVGKLPGPIGLIFQNCYKHISCEDEKIFRDLRDLTQRLNKKKSKISSRAMSRAQQELGAQWVSQKAGNPGSSRTIRDVGQQVSKFKGSHLSPQAVQGVVSNTLIPRSNLLLEDDKCQVCGDGDYTDSNLIVYCAKCNICTHQLCYGLATLPKGNWICDLCRYYGFDGNGMRCPLCPRVGGIMRRCNINSTDATWNQYSSDYLFYMKSGPPDSSEEPPELISPSILAFERMTIQGDYKAHLTYDYFGCLTMGLRPPASPRPPLAWLHLSCLPSYTDLRPYTNPIGSELQSRGHLTTPIQLPEIFPTNHKVPWLYREILPAISDSSATNTPDSRKQKSLFIPYEQVIQLPDLSIDMGKDSRRSQSKQSTSSNPRFKVTGQNKDIRSLRSRIQREASTPKAPDEYAFVPQSPARKVFVQSPPPNSSRVRTSRELRRRSHRDLEFSGNFPIFSPILSSQTQMKHLIDDPEQTTLEAYRPEWAAEDQQKVIGRLGRLKGSPAGQQKELLGNLVLPCTCCYMSSGFLFSCPKCNRATHGSCGVTAGARRIGDRITCKEHTEDEIFTLLKACQDKNKNEILSWLELDDQCVPMEKAIKEIKIISQQIKEIQLQEDQHHPIEEPNPKVRNKRKPEIKKQTLKKHINQIVITISKGFTKRSGKSIRENNETSGFRKSPEYFFSDGIPSPDRLSKVAQEVSPAYTRIDFPRSQDSSARCHQDSNDDFSFSKTQFAAQTTNDHNSLPEKFASPLSISEIVGNKTGVPSETTRFRLTRDHQNLSLEEIPTQLQTPPRLGLVLDCKHEPVSHEQPLAPAQENGDHSVLTPASNTQKVDEIEIKVQPQDSEQGSSRDHPAYMVKAESLGSCPTADAGQPTDLPIGLGLPISTDIKLKIEETLRLAVEPIPESLLEPPFQVNSDLHQLIPPQASPTLPVLSVEIAASWQFCPGDSSIKLELHESTRQVHRICFKPTYPKTDPSARPLMKVSFYGAQPNGSPVIFTICARSRRMKAKEKSVKISMTAVKGPDQETNPHMLAKRMILIPKMTADEENVKIEEPTNLPIEFSSMYKTEPQVVPDSSIRTLQRIPLLLDQQPPMGTPPRLTLSLVENREIFRPSSKDWEGMFNSYLRDKEALTKKRPREPTESKSLSRRIVTSVKINSQQPRSYNFKSSRGRTRGVSQKAPAN